MQNVILVGMGFMGAMHTQAYTQLPNAKLVGVVDAETEATTKKLQELNLGDVPVFATLEEALKVDCDVIDICLPTDLHTRFALKAIEAGKALFIEKPLALTSEEAEQILSAAEKAGVPVQVGHCIRFWPEYMAFRDFHQSGKGGKLLSLTLQRRSGRPGYPVENWLNVGERSGGAALDLHIHDTDFIVSLLGTPQSVCSRTTVDSTGPSHIFTHYNYGDTIVSAEGGWNYPPQWGFQMAFQAIYENATIEYDSGSSPSLSITTGTEPKEAMPFKSTGGEQSQLSGGNISDLGGYFNELAYFIEQLESGSPIEEATLQQAALSLKVNLAELASAKSQQPVELA